MTVDDVQAQAAAILDQNESTSAISTADYSLRLSYLNRRERSWAESGKWRVLYKEFNSNTSLGTSNATLTLPADFREIASYPKIAGDLYPLIRPQERGQYLASSDKFVELQGNSYAGYSMIINPATSTGFLASGASIFVPYYSIPTSLASPANQVMCPNPQYLVQGVIADVWEAREDPRYPQAKADANVLLQNMLEFEFTPGEASADDRVKSVDQTKHSMRWGE